MTEQPDTVPAERLHDLHRQLGNILGISPKERVTDTCRRDPYACRYRATDAQLHERRRHPEWEYETTEGQRKAWDDIDTPPEGDGWERNVDAGRDGWERFDYTEESYWRRPKQVAGQAVTADAPEHAEPPMPYGVAKLDKRYTARELMDRIKAAEAEAVYERQRANGLAEAIGRVRKVADTWPEYDGYAGEAADVIAAVLDALNGGTPKDPT